MRQMRTKLHMCGNACNRSHDGESTPPHSAFTSTSTATNTLANERTKRRESGASMQVAGRVTWVHAACSAACKRRPPADHVAQLFDDMMSIYGDDSMTILLHHR